MKKMIIDDSRVAIKFLKYHNAFQRKENGYLRGTAFFKECSDVDIYNGLCSIGVNKIETLDDDEFDLIAHAENFDACIIKLANMVQDEFGNDLCADEEEVFGDCYEVIDEPEFLDYIRKDEDEDVLENIILSIKPENAKEYNVKDCRVLVTEDNVKGENVLHGSISHPTRLPDLKELSTMKNFYMKKADTGICFPPESEFVNLHKNCLHLYELSEWKNINFQELLKSKEATGEVNGEKYWIIDMNYDYNNVKDLRYTHEEMKNFSHVALYFQTGKRAFSITSNKMLFVTYRGDK